MKSVFYPLGPKRAPSWKEECGLCGRVLPYYSLRRCFRCGKLFCRSCITEDLGEKIRNMLELREEVCVPSAFTWRGGLHGPAGLSSPFPESKALLGTIFPSQPYETEAGGTTRKAAVKARHG